MSGMQPPVSGSSASGGDASSSGGGSGLGGCLLWVLIGFGVALLIAWGPAILGVVLFSGAFALAVKAIMLVFWLIASRTGRDEDGSP